MGKSGKAIHDEAWIRENLEAGRKTLRRTHIRALP
jgi:hypothetical protein